MKTLVALLNKIEKLLKSLGVFLVLGFFLGVLIDLINFQENSDPRIFLLTFLGIIILRVYRLKSDSTFKIAFAFLVLLFIFFVTARGNLVTDRIAVWLYITMIVGVVQQFLEFRKE